MSVFLILSYYSFLIGGCQFDSIIYNPLDLSVAGEGLPHCVSISVHRLAGYWTSGLWSGDCGSHWSSAEMAATERKHGYCYTLQVKVCLINSYPAKSRGISSDT